MPAYLSLLGISWTVFHNMFVKVLLPENNPPPVLGLLMQIALSSFPASSFSVAENESVCRNYIHILQLKVTHLGLDMSLIASKKKKKQLPYLWKRSVDERNGSVIGIFLSVLFTNRCVCEMKGEKWRG